MSLAALKSKLNSRKAEQAAKKAQYIKPERLKPGKNRIRILPSWQKGPDGKPNPEGDFFHDYGMHYVNDKEGKLAAVYVCTDKTYARDCPVCDAVREGVRLAKDTGNVALEKLMGQAKSTQRVLVNALLRDSEEPDKPVILELPNGVFESITDQIIAFADEGVSVVDPNEGHDFIVTKSGSGIDTEYSVAVAPRATVVTFDEAKITDLAAYCSQESEQGLLKAVRATTAVTGLPEPATLRLAGPSGGSKATGTEGAFITPPAASAAPAAAATATAAVATGSVLSTAAAAADEAEAELDALEGEIEDTPFEVTSEPVEEAPKAAEAPADDLANEISASDDDLDDILDGLDDL